MKRFEDEAIEMINWTEDPIEFQRQYEQFWEEEKEKSPAS